MTTAAQPSAWAPARERTMGIVAGTLLHVRKRRGLAILVGLLTIGVVLIAYIVSTILFFVNADRFGGVGGTDGFVGIVTLLSLLGTLVGAIVGAAVGADDVSTGTFRDLVLTGRSRRALFAARFPAGLLYILPFIVIAMLIAGVWSQLGLHGHHAPSISLMIEGTAFVYGTTAFWFVIVSSFAALTGSRAYSIVAALAWTLVVSNILQSISYLGRARYALPEPSMQSFAPQRMIKTLKPLHVPHDAAVWWLAVWIVVFVALGLWRTLRRDT